MARLTAARRKALTDRNFAEPAERKYPIEDKNHADNALARVSEFGSPEEKAAVRKKVHEKFPGIGKK